MLLKRMTEDELTDRLAGVMSDMSGLVDEEAAMYLIASDRGDLRGEIVDVGSIAAGAWVNLVGHVTSVGWSKSGHDVSWLTIEDGTGKVRIVLWRKELADLVRSGGVAPGDRLLVVNGRVREGRAPEGQGMHSGLEVHVDARGALEVLPQTFDDIASLAEGEFVCLRGVVSETSQPRAFYRRDGSEGLITTATLFDGTGEVKVVAWDEAARILGGAGVGDEIAVTGALVKVRDGRFEAHSVRGTEVRILRPS